MKKVLVLDYTGLPDDLRERADSLDAADFCVWAELSTDAECFVDDRDYDAEPGYIGRDEALCYNVDKLTFARLVRRFGLGCESIYHDTLADDRALGWAGVPRSLRR